MAINKNAYLRYQILDKCLSNKGRNYSIAELLQEVNRALLENNSNSDGIELRQLRSDIAHLKSEPFNAPIKAIREGKHFYYAYRDKDFSINKAPLSETEILQLQQTIVMLERFVGNENFVWLNELAPTLKDRLGPKEKAKKIISLESDEYNSGTKYISKIFNAITYKRVLTITYMPFEGPVRQLIFHPYHLKQTNNRWFALGRNAEFDNNFWVVPLDRIENFSEITEPYLEFEYDWEEHFQDFLGVTKETGKPVEVILKFSKRQGHYVLTKPIHGNQRAEWTEEDNLLVKMKLIPNFELQSRILSYGDEVEVLAPENLRCVIGEKLKNAAKKY